MAEADYCDDYYEYWNDDCDENCENCKYYKKNILIPCKGKCKVARVKRNWNSKSCQFFEKRELKAEVR